MDVGEPARRYFDNAATSFPKPPDVVEAACAALRDNAASAGRGAYREALAAGRVLDECRAVVKRFFGGAPGDQVVFGLNGTDALNLALKGVLRPGDHVVTTAMEHNSVLRPLHALRVQRGVTFTAIDADPETTRINVDELVRALQSNTRLVALNHASNVTGAIQPLDAVASLCREREVLLLIDAAQSAGHLPLDLTRSPVDLLACSGHKGLLGPLGTGVLVIAERAAAALQTVREGGTGSASEQPQQPDALPDRLEAGSHNLVGLAGLRAAVEWLQARGVVDVRRHERDLCERMIERLSRHEHLHFYGPRSAEQRVGVFSVRVEGYEPAELSALLEERFGLLTRSGLHCAPLAHQTIGTLRRGGTTRLSFGPFTTPADVDFAADALTEIAAAAPA
ncbi:MAG: aminotransferase class V-fold PLP-dependent enzyme [Phycisphaerae bacterium]